MVFKEGALRCDRCGNGSANRYYLLVEVVPRVATMRGVSLCWDCRLTLASLITRFLNEVEDDEYQSSIGKP